MNQPLESVAVPMELKEYKFEVKQYPIQFTWTKMTELLMDDFSIDFAELAYEVRTSMFLRTMDTISNNEAERIKKFIKQMGLDK